MKYLLLLFILVGCVNQQAAEDAAYQRMGEYVKCVEFGKSLNLTAEIVDDQGHRYCFVALPSKKRGPGHRFSFEELYTIERYKLMLRMIK